MEYMRNSCWISFWYAFVWFYGSISKKSNLNLFDSNQFYQKIKHEKHQLLLYLSLILLILFLFPPTSLILPILSFLPSLILFFNPSKNSFTFSSWFSRAFLISSTDVIRTDWSKPDWTSSSVHSHCEVTQLFWQFDGLSLSYLRWEEGEGCESRLRKWSKLLLSSSKSSSENRFIPKL